MKIREKGIGFRKRCPFEFGMVVVGMACFLIFSCILAVFLSLQSNKSQKKQNIENFSYELDSYMFSIDNLSQLVFRDNFLNTFRALEREELYAVSPIDVIAARENIRYYDTVLGFYGKTYAYFPLSECFFSSDGVYEEDNFFLENALDAQVRAAVETELDQPFRAKAVVNGGESIFYVFHADNFTVSLLYILSKAVFADMVSTHISPGEGIAVLSAGEEFYREGKESGPSLDRSFKNLDIRILYYYDTPVLQIVLTCAGLALIFALLFLGVYKIVDASLRKYYDKVQEITMANDLDVDVKSASVLVLFKNFLQSSADKERELRTMLRENDRKMIATYLRLWLSGADENEEEISRALEFMKFDLSGFHAVYCFNGDCPAAEEAGLMRVIDGVYLCAGSGFPQFAERCGQSNAYRKPAGLKKAYAEASIALRLANLFEVNCVQYNDVVDDRGENAFAEPLSVLESDMTAGAEAHIAAAGRLFAIARELPLHLSVYRAVCRAGEILNGVRREYNLEEEEFILPNSCSLAETEKCIAEKIAAYSEKLAVKLGNKYVHIFKEILDYVDENLVDQDLSLKKIAGHFGYSVSYISKIFSENGEENYNDYINRRRIDLAKQLLRENKSVNQIAALCGFSSDTSFRRVFLRVCKITPLKYKALKWDVPVE